MSSSDRAHRRGGMAFLEFEAEMIKLGFVEQPPQGGLLHQYTHPNAKHQSFDMAPGERYSDALKRLRAELETTRIASKGLDP
jgi:hypothetical protein